MAIGDFTMLLPDDPTIYAVARKLAGATLLVVASFSGANVTVDIPHSREWSQSMLLLGNSPMIRMLASGIMLRPWWARVF